jgi:streptomycin 6-kinase
MDEIGVPRVVRQKALSLGPAGSAWLATLPSVVARIAADWGVEVGPPMSGGSDSLVAEARTTDGTQAVLKVPLPSQDVRRQAWCLAAARGAGYVRLLRMDNASGAMLLERLGRPLIATGLPVPAQIEAICETLGPAWRAPRPRQLPTGATKAGWLGSFIEQTWGQLDRPCSEQVIALAIRFSEIRAAAFRPERSVLVHGDAHNNNLLESPDGGFRLIDPDGLIAEPACDLAVPMREWSRELLESGDTISAARARAQLLADLTGVDEESIWQWGYIERVSTGLLCRKVGRTALGQEILDVAERLAEAGGSGRRRRTLT